MSWTTGIPWTGNWRFKDGTNQDRTTNIPMIIPPMSRTCGADTHARDYAASLRWNLDLSPTHSLYVQSSAQHWERIQEWRACAPQIVFSPSLRQLYDLSPQLRRSAVWPSVG